MALKKIAYIGFLIDFIEHLKQEHIQKVLDLDYRLLNNFHPELVQSWMFILKLIQVQNSLFHLITSSRI